MWRIASLDEWGTMHKLLEAVIKRTVISFVFWENLGWRF